MGSFEMHNPSFQIDVYLRDTPPKWGILCNGRLWRLYHETTSYKLDSYYEVDLPSLLARGDLETFKYFYLFFRLEALPRSVDGDYAVFCQLPAIWKNMKPLDSLE